MNVRAWLRATTFVRRPSRRIAEPARRPHGRARPRRRQATTALGTAVLFGSASVAHAASESSDGWHFAFAPYVWFAGMKGDLGIHGTKAEVDEDFGDLLDVTEYGLTFQFEADRGRLGLVLSPNYAKVGDAGKGPLGVHTDGESATLIL